MKRTIFVVLFLCVLSVFAQQKSGAELLKVRKNFVNGSVKNEIGYFEHFKKLISNWDNVNLLVNIGDDLERVGDLYRAKSYYMRAYSESQGKKDLEKKISLLQKRIDRLENKIEEKMALIDENPMVIQPVMSLAGIYLGLSNYSLARKYAYKAQSLNKNNPVANMFVKTFERRFAIPTKEAIGMSNDAVGQYKMGNKAKAYELLYGAVKKSISSPFVFQNFAKILIMDKNFGGALRCLQEAHYLNKKMISTLFDLGNVCFVLGKHESAIEYYQKLIKLNANSPRVLFMIGKCFDKLGDSEEAVKYYKRAKQFDSAMVDKLSQSKTLIIRGVQVPVK
jgi:tetratricopeptide (TPR) repeat protein